MFFIQAMKQADLHRLNRHTIDVFDRLDSLFQRHEFAQSLTNSFPPHNIRKSGDKYLIEMAIAGFNKEEVKIKKEKDYLFIEGEKEAKSDGNFLHQGIANRSFKKSFVLGERMKVVGAEMRDGMLFIGLEQEVPPDEQAEEITIDEGKLKKHMLPS